MTKSDENRRKSGSNQSFSEMLAQSRKDAAERESPRMHEPIGLGNQSQGAKKPEEAKSAPLEEEFTLKQFAAWSVVAGVAGVPVVLLAEIARYALFIPALLIVFGALLFLRIRKSEKEFGDAKFRLFHAKREADEYRRTAEGELAQAHKDLSAKEQEHQKSLKSARQQSEKEKEELRGGMLAEIERYQNEAQALDARLQNEKLGRKEEVEKLGLQLNHSRQTLAYYSKYEWLDAYVGQTALRECGGVYVVSNPADGKVKIGLTDNFARRFKEIQSACNTAGIAKVVPEILVPLDEGKHTVEQKLHKEFAKNQTAGEWFNIPPKEAVAAVLTTVRERRVANFKTRQKIPVTEESDKPSVRFGVNWETVPPQLAAMVAKETAEDGTTALQMAAAYSKNPKVIEALIEAGVNLAQTTKDGKTAIQAAVHAAAAYNTHSEMYEIFRALKRAGANLGEMVFQWESTPIMTAATHNNIEAISGLHNAGCALPDAECACWMAVNVFSSEVAREIAELCIFVPGGIMPDEGIDWNQEVSVYSIPDIDPYIMGPEYCTPLQFAVAHGNAAVVDGFICGGAPLVYGDQKESILHYAAANCHDPEVVKVLMKHVDVNELNNRGETPLDIAIRDEDRSAVADELREAGGYTCDTGAGVCFGVNWKTATPADVGKINHNDRGGDFFGAPIHWAARFCPNPEVISALAASGGNVNAQNPAWWSNPSPRQYPMHWAAYNPNPSGVVRALVQTGADVNQTGKSGWTPLHEAAWAEQANAITALAEAGADINRADKYGKTPLFLGLEEENLDINGGAMTALSGCAITALIESGADVNLKNENGESAADIAERLHGENAEVTKFLRKREGR